MDRILEALKCFRIVKVVAVFSPQNVRPWPTVTSEEVQECLWPRVTMKVGDRVKVVPMKDLIAALKKKAVPGEKSYFEIEVLGFCGGSKNSHMEGQRAGALAAAVADFRSKVQKSLWRAARTRAVLDKARKYWVREHKEKFRANLTKWLEGQGLRVDLVQNYEIAEVIRDFRKVEVVRHVLDT